ncbi:MAG: hypothetical protein J5982_05905 [Bacilli bacterium]|nr:hypothetical protein [Bacilli bacterium]
MGLLDRIINRVVDNVASEASSAIGIAVGNTVESMATEAGKSLTNELKEKNQQRELEIKQNAINAELKMEEQRKSADLPTHCPHCGAPTNKNIVCEYCECKIVE